MAISLKGFGNSSGGNGPQISGVSALPPQAAEVRLPTPPGPPNSLIFSYTGANDSFIVPDGVTTLTVKAWGAGGGGGNVGAGGSGGFVHDTSVSVTPGETLTIVVGQGGEAVGGTNAYGGGGAGGTTVNSILLPALGSGGGGGSYLLRTGTPIVAAGAGGGGGEAGSEGLSRGGNGGGLIGGAGERGYNMFGHGGGGGTQITGGAKDIIRNDTPAKGYTNPGALLQGGDATNSYKSGGGGGGYYGGGGGGWMAGGGGGSSLSPTSGSTESGTLGVAGGDTDIDYPGASIGVGGTGPTDPGFNGHLIIIWF